MKKCRMFKFDPKRKFNNKKMSTPDGEFDSKGEWQRWIFLKEAEKNGQISNLRRQVKYILIPTQYKAVEVKLKTKTKVVQRVAEHEISYKADFVYEKDGETVVEDYKGYPNDRWPYVKKMMLFFHGVAVREVKKPTEPI